MRSLTLAAALLLAAPPAIATPQIWTPPVASVPDPADTPYPGGTIALAIDASDTLRGLYRVTETIPLAPDARNITLLFPEWLPGNHAPRGPIAELVDLRFTVEGKPVSWTRDPLDVHAFHIDLPDGARELVARFIHTSPLTKDEGRVTMTREMLNLQWEKMSLYPAGHYVRQIRMRPSVTLPRGWTAATALEGQRAAGDRLDWDETDYETLVDSPIFAGAHFRRWDIGNNVDFNVVGDTPDLTALAPNEVATLTSLVDEALAVFGAPPFDHYDFLVALTDRMGGIGLEHLRSSENQLEPRSFLDWDSYDWDRNVLAHEFAHAWNGKYRRPAKLWTPDYRQPMQDNLLWVYEGQTQFWGWVLAARSGLQSKDTVLGMIASQAGYYSQQPGRAWRSVADTTLDPVIAARKPKPYPSLARSEDYYNEGALVWLEADQLIRDKTGGRKGLDDFARAFFARRGDTRVSTYGFKDVVAALNEVLPYDWADFLQRRIGEAGQPAPLAGIEQGGYRLVWKDEPNPYDKARMEQRRNLPLTYSLGLSIDQDGTVAGTVWDSPAFNAGIVTGAKIVAVNSIAYTADALKQAITGAKGSGKPIQLLVQRGDRFQTIPVSYAGGLRWPWLERVRSQGQAPLDRLLTPKRNPLAR